MGPNFLEKRISVGHTQNKQKIFLKKWKKQIISFPKLFILSKCMFWLSYECFSVLWGCFFAKKGHFQPEQLCQLKSGTPVLRFLFSRKSAKFKYWNLSKFPLIVRYNHANLSNGGLFWKSLLPFLRRIYALHGCSIKSFKFGNGSRMFDEKLVILEFKYLQNKKW